MSPSTYLHTILLPFKLGIRNGHEDNPTVPHNCAHIVMKSMTTIYGVNAQSNRSPPQHWEQKTREPITQIALQQQDVSEWHSPFRAMAFISEGSLSLRCNFRLETDDDFPKLKKERQLPTGDFFILFWGLFLWEKKINNIKRAKSLSFLLEKKE